MSLMYRGYSVSEEFPALTQKVQGQPLIYLDSAASALKPKCVVDRISHYYLYESSNVHRGSHFLANLGTQNFEAARTSVAQFIGAKNAEEIIFTKGTTESINLVAWSLGQSLAKNSKIVITELEHHANFVPWQMVAKIFELRLEYVRLTLDGELDLEDLATKIKGAALLAVTHGSNTLGTVSPLKDIVKVAREHGCLILADGAQWIANRAVNVSDLDVDFYAFSSHKLFGPYGHGVLYGKKELLNKMAPYQGGGSMISTVSIEGTTFNSPPFKFEAGTPHTAGAVGLNAAIEFVNELKPDLILQHENQLVTQAMMALQEVPDLKMLGPPPGDDRLPLVSFTMKGLNASDVGFLLDQQGIAVRTGHHCTQPLLKHLGVDSTVRASFSVYNDEQDIERLVSGLLKARKMLL